jgi:hypothetical protein
MKFAGDSANTSIPARSIAAAYARRAGDRIRERQRLQHHRVDDREDRELLTPSGQKGNACDGGRALDGVRMP